MKKFWVIFLILFFVSFVSSSVEVHNITVEPNYPLNQIIDGEINFSIVDESITTVIRTNKDQKKLLLDFLNDSSAIFYCNPNDCSSSYDIADGGSSVSFSIPKGESQFAGFVLTGEDLVVNSIDFDISSTFSEGEEIPLSIRFFEDLDNEWTFQEFSSTTYRKPVDYGSYDETYKDLGPYLRQITYCSQFSIFETDKFYVGVDLYVGNETGDVNILLYNDIGIYVTEEKFNPSSGINNVILQAPEDEIFSSGLYYVCIKSEDDDSNYRIYRDTESENFRGFNYIGEDFDFESAEGEKNIDYAIFIAEFIYGGSNLLSRANFTGHLSNINDFIYEKYNGDCSDSCYIPIEIFSGVDQEVTLNNVNIDYVVDYGGDSENSVYSFDQVPGSMNYEGVPLNLDALGFLMNESDLYKFYINNEKIHEQEINITPAPLIQGIYPQFIPAGINSKIFADIIYDGDNSTLVYEWDFGDGSSQTTYTNVVFHEFPNISEYTIKLNVTSGSDSNYFDQKIETISPKNFVTIFYDSMINDLNLAKSDISTFPPWEQDSLTKASDLLNYQDELSRIKRKIDQAYEDEHYLEIAGLINAIDVPRRVFINGEFPINGPSDSVINLNAVTDYTGESLEFNRTEEEYYNSISYWQQNAVSYTGNIQKISLQKSSGVVSKLISTYQITVSTEYPEEMVLVIDVPIDQITFNNNNFVPKSYADATVIPISSGSTTLEFFIVGDEQINYFVTPYLENLELEPEICNVEGGCDEACNFNYVCDEGESYETCRSDCKPVNLMIYYMIILFFAGLILYTVFQVWYDKKYQKILFPDEKRLYNLLIFIIAAQTKGMTRDEVKKALKEKGWTNERIEFAIKKANGERTGLYEIIPISKISAAIRKNSASKKYPKNKPGNQNLQNLNNESFPSPHTQPKHLPPRHLRFRRPHGPGLHNPVNNSSITNPGQQNQRNINKGINRDLNK